MSKNSRFGLLVVTFVGSIVGVGAVAAPLPSASGIPTSSTSPRAGDDAARTPGLLDMTGVWSRQVKRSRPDHFDPNVVETEDQRPPLKPAYDKIWKENLQKAVKGDYSFDTSLNCLPKGFPRVMMAPLGMEILATPGQVNFFNEASQDTVRVYLDGRKELADHEPTYMGFTTGRWANGVLTTETRNMRSDTLLDGSGIPHSDAMTVKQQMRFLNRDALENIVTVSDPKAFTSDWVVRMVYHRAPPSRYVDEATCH